MGANAIIELSASEIEEVRSVAGVEETYAIGTGFQRSTLYQQNGNPVPNLIYDDALFQWLLEQSGKTELLEEEPNSSV